MARAEFLVIRSLNLKSLGLRSLRLRQARNHLKLPGPESAHPPHTPRQFSATSTIKNFPVAAANEKLKTRSALRNSAEDAKA